MLSFVAGPGNGQLISYALTLSGELKLQKPAYKPELGIAPGYIILTTAKGRFHRKNLSCCSARKLRERRIDVDSGIATAPYLMVLNERYADECGSAHFRLRLRNALHETWHIHCSHFEREARRHIWKQREQQRALVHAEEAARERETDARFRRFHAKGLGVGIN